MTDTWLPPGVHPSDASRPLGDAITQSNHPVPHDSADLYAPRGRESWNTDNPQALPVFQRLSSNWAAGVVIVNNSSADSNVARVVSRRPGRTRLSLWVPANFIINGVLTPTPAGVVIAEDEGKIQQASEGVPLFVGDSIDIQSEGGVWAALLPSQTTGVVAWVHCWDTKIGTVDNQ